MLLHSLRRWGSFGLLGPVALLLSALPLTSSAQAPSVGQTATAFHRPPGAVAIHNGWAAPLAGARPAWFTAALERQVLAAPGRPVAAPNDAPLPSTIGIRPGAWMVAPAGCTMNFVFSNAVGALGIGTAGHCVEALAQHVVLLTLLPGVTDQPVLLDIGTVVVHRDNGIGDDFALVRIRPELHPWVSATTALVAGPCGAYTGAGPELVAHYGHGLAIGTAGTPRVGLALTWHTDAFGWDSPAIFGDSGSPVRVADLAAAGNLTHLVVSSDWLPSIVAGTRISRILELAPGWSLVDSPLC